MGGWPGGLLHQLRLKLSQSMIEVAVEFEVWDLQQPETLLEQELLQNVLERSSKLP